MRTAVYVAERSRAAARPDLVLVPPLIVIGAVVFNAGLAFVNGNVLGLTSAPVIASEILFVGAAHMVALANYKPQMAPWYTLLGMFFAFALIRSIASASFDVKYLRDVMIIPTFVVLGMTFDSRRLGRVVVAIQVVMLVFLLLEALDTQAYSDLFRIENYYINTRGYDAQDFWNKGSSLFVSAVRPDARFFSLIDLHRLSSIFLEPVSLGNYCMVIVAFLCAFYGRLGVWTRWFLIVTTAMAAIGCDGRLAMASAIPMVLCSALAPRLPRYSALIYIPGVTALAFVLVYFGHYQPGGDDFPGRIAHTVYLLRQYGVPEFLGLSDEYMSKAVDSGLAYVITTQSIFIMLVLWALIVLAASDTPQQTRYTHALCLYLASNLMVSFALLTIKTAALLWFIYGSLQARPNAKTPATQSRPARGKPVGWQRRDGLVAGGQFLLAGDPAGG